MDMKQEKMSALHDELLRVETERLEGAADYTLDEVISIMNAAVHEVRRAGA